MTTRAGGRTEEKKKRRKEAHDLKLPNFESLRWIPKNGIFFPPFFGFRPFVGFVTLF